jgi:hypothetical protein
MPPPVLLKRRQQTPFFVETQSPYRGTAFRADKSPHNMQMPLNPVSQLPVAAGFCLTGHPE